MPYLSGYVRRVRRDAIVGRETRAVVQKVQMTLGSQPATGSPLWDLKLCHRYHEFAEKSSKIVPLGAPRTSGYRHAYGSVTRSLDASVDTDKGVFDENASNHLPSV
jgi:hypothetical protein